jgi:hypothetical protein
VIRVVGNAEIYVDVDWPSRTVRVLGPGKASLLWLTRPVDLRLDLLGAEWRLEGVPGVQDWSRSGLVELDLANALIEIGTSVQITAVQSEHLRTLLERAETVLRTGVGDMETA